MPVDSKHPQYEAFESKHEMCRDAYEGESKVKQKSVKYLPLLSGMTENGLKYQGYLSRAMFYSATRRTVEGLAGIVDRKPPNIVVEKSLPWAEDIDGFGMSLHGFTNQLVSEAVLINWQGILVDRREGYEYPYPIQYRAEQIINWHYENGKLVFVMLREEVNTINDDYKVETISQYRELSIDEGAYVVRVHRQNGNTKKFEVVEQYTPDVRGESLDVIPFIFVSSNNALENPPLLDMVGVNFHHYKNSADYEHGIHFTGLPTPYIVGMQNKTDGQGNPATVELGSETCLLLDEGGSAGFMEFTGQGLSALKEAMEIKKQEMASLGARLLQNEKKSAEAAETARINKSGDSNIIASIVTGVERALNQMLHVMAAWQGANPEANTIELNRDFVDEGMSAQDITALVGAMQARAMSLDTLLYNFKKNDMLPDDRTIEEEKAAIESATPSLDGDNDIDIDDDDEDEDEDED